MLLSGSIAIVSWQLQHWILSSHLHFSLCLTIHKSRFYVSRLKARSGKLDANWLPICIWFFCFEGYIDWKLSYFTENMIILSLFASFLAIIINLLQNVQIIVLYFTDYCNIWNTWESWFQASFTTDSLNVVLLIIFTVFNFCKAWSWLFWYAVCQSDCFNLFLKGSVKCVLPDQLAGPFLNSPLGKPWDRFLSSPFDQPGLSDPRWRSTLCHSCCCPWNIQTRPQ